MFPIMAKKIGGRSVKRALRCSDDFGWISTGGELNEPRRNRNNHRTLFSAGNEVVRELQSAVDAVPECL
jgi:hypothetical protein